MPQKCNQGTAALKTNRVFIRKGAVVYKLTDQEMAEYQIECCLENLRSSDPSSVFSRNKWRKSIKNEMFFLEQEHPDSYVLHLDIGDVSLELE